MKKGGRGGQTKRGLMHPLVLVKESSSVAVSKKATLLQLPMAAICFIEAAGAKDSVHLPESNSTIFQCYYRYTGTERFAEFLFCAVVVAEWKLTHMSLFFAFS